MPFNQSADPSIDMDALNRCLATLTTNVGLSKPDASEESLEAIHAFLVSRPRDEWEARQALLQLHAGFEVMSLTGQAADAVRSALWAELSRVFAEGPFRPTPH